MRWALAERRASGGGEGSAAFFYPFGNRHPGHTREPDNAALRVALHQQGIDLGVLRRFADGGRHKQALVPTRRALVLGPAVIAAVASKVVTAAFGTIMGRLNHAALYAIHPIIDHHQN